MFKKENQSFNLQLLVWIAQHEFAYFKGKMFQQEYPKDYAQILIDYQSLFTVDKVQSPSIALKSRN